MRLLVFKLLLIAAAALAARYYLTKTRSAGRDRLIVIVLLLGLIVGVVDPETTSWVAKQLGIGRGVDLAFYVGFLLLFFLVGVQRVRLREQQRSIATMVRELALLRARTPGSRAESAENPPGGSSARPNA